MSDVEPERTGAPSVALEPLRALDPRELGGWRILGRLGAGGMGVAFLAERDGQWAVVKMVRSDLAEDRHQRARIARELEAMRRAQGAHTAALFDSDLDGDPAWFAMEFIAGSTLVQRVSDRGPMSQEEARSFAGDLVQVLDAVHGAGIVHRDLKPSNIMLSPRGPVLIDFGIADLSEGTQLTRTGAVVGSTGWLAPEQVTGDAITTATDVHAWGLCVLFALTAQAPFGSDTASTALYRVLEMTPQVPDTISEPLRGLLTSALTKDPSRRPTVDHLTNTLTPDPSTSDRLPELPPPDQVAATPRRRSDRTSYSLIAGGLAASGAIAVTLAVLLGYVPLPGSPEAADTDSNQSAGFDEPAPLCDLQRIPVVCNEADLSGRDFTQVNFRGGSLRGSDLTGANLTGAELFKANLTGANLTTATLKDARIVEADLRGADLRKADLTGALLRRSDLTGADLTGADLTGADLEEATMTWSTTCPDGTAGPCSWPLFVAAPEPTFSVDVAYSGDARGEARFEDSLTWTVDLCTDDDLLLEPDVRDDIKVTARKDGAWKRLSAGIRVQRGGRCGDQRVNILISRTEPKPAEELVGRGWSDCVNYRIVVPETANFARARLDTCVRTRADAN